MERETEVIYVLVRVELSGAMDESGVDEVVCNMDYTFDHPDIEGTEISDVSMSYPSGF